MRTRPPPFPFLSQDGQVAACLCGDAIVLIRTRVGVAIALPLPHEARHMAFSPLASSFAVANSRQLSLFRGEPPFPLLASTDIPAPLFRIALAEDSLLAGTAVFDDQKSTLCTWRGANLQPAFVGEGVPLGRVAPF